MASAHDEERNRLRLQAWEQRNQETSQSSRFSPENSPVFGEPYKVYKGDELSARIRRMLGSYEDVNSPPEAPPIPASVHVPQPDHRPPNSDKPTKLPFHSPAPPDATGPSAAASSGQPAEGSTSSPGHHGQSSANVQDVQSSANVQDVQSSANVQDVQSSANVHHGQSSANIHHGQSTSIVHDGQSSANIHDGQSSANVHDGQSSANVHDRQSSANVHDRQSSANVHDGQSSANIHDGQSSANVHDGQSSANVHDGQSSANVHDGQSSANVHDGQSSANVHDGQSSANVHDGQSSANVHDGQSSHNDSPSLNHRRSSELSPSVHLKKSEIPSDLMEMSSLCPDAKPPPPSRSGDHRSAGTDSEEAFAGQQLQRTDLHPAGSASTVDVSTHNLKPSPKDPAVSHPGRTGPLPSHTFPPPLSSKQPCAVLKPTAYVRPMDGQDQVSSESPGLKRSPEPCLPPAGILAKPEPSRADAKTPPVETEPPEGDETLPEPRRTRAAETRRVDDILREMTESWPPLLAALHIREPPNFLFPVKEAERVASRPGPKSRDSISSNIKPQLSSNSRDSSSSSESDGPTEGLRPSDPPQAAAGPAPGPAAWQLGNWIRCSQQSSSHPAVGATGPPGTARPHASLPQQHRESPQDKPCPRRDQKLVSAGRGRKPSAGASEAAAAPQRAGRPVVKTKAGRGEDTRDRPGRGEDTRDRSGRGEDTRDRSGRGEDTRDGPGRGEDTRDAPGRGEDTRDRAGRGEDTRDRAGRGEDTRDRSGRGEDTRDGPGRGEDTRDAPGRGEDTRDRAGRGEDTRDRAGRGEDTRDGPGRGEDTRDRSASKAHLKGTKVSLKGRKAADVSLLLPPSSCSAQSAAPPPRAPRPPRAPPGTESRSKPKETRTSHRSGCRRPPVSLLVKIKLSLLCRVPRPPPSTQQGAPSSGKPAGGGDGGGGGATKTSKKHKIPNADGGGSSAPRKRHKLDPSQSEAPNKPAGRKVKQPPRRPPPGRSRAQAPRERPAADQLEPPRRSGPAPSPGQRLGPAHRLLQSDDRLYPVKHYIKEAKRLKHRADAEPDKLSKAFSYLEAAMFFVESAVAMETDPQVSMSSYTMLAETLELLRFVLKMKNSLDSSSSPSEKDFLALCVRCQSLLQMSMFRHKLKTALKYSKILTEHFSASAPAPRGSARDRPSPGTPAPPPAGPQAPPPAGVPPAVEQMAVSYVNITALVLGAHELWEEAELLAEGGGGLLAELDSVLGPLSLSAGLSFLVVYARQGVQRLRLSSLRD